MTARQALEQWQQYQILAYLRQIIPSMLHPKQRATLTSIEVYYDLDKRLSSKQIDCLQRYMDIRKALKRSWIAVAATMQMTDLIRR